MNTGRQLKHPKPDYVLAFDRPAGTEVKCINGNWYLYERLSVYDPEKKRKRKKSGALLGKIAPGGLVPKGSRPSPDPAPSRRELECVEYGASSYLLSSNAGMAEELRLALPDIWRETLCMAVARCLGETSLKRMPLAYEASWLSQALPGARMGARGCSEALRELGRRRGDLSALMRSRLGGFGGYVMIDGHRLLSASSGLPYAQPGYDSRCRHSPQVNLVYLFGLDGSGAREPLYYKQYAGSVPDCMALADLRAEARMERGSVTAIADKGFASKEAFEELQEAGIHYVVPVKRNSGDIGGYPESLAGYEGVFPFQDRAVWWLTRHFDAYDVHLFYDMALATHEARDAALRLEAAEAAKASKASRERARRASGKGRMSDVELAALDPVDPARALSARPSLGTLAIRTDRCELCAREVYCLYKTRQEIEVGFRGYDDTLGMNASWMRDTEAYEGWLFVNHLALRMLYGVLDHIASLDLTSRYSFDDVVKTLKGVRANKIDGKWYTTKFTKHTRKLCEDLGVILDEPLIPQEGLPKVAEL